MVEMRESFETEEHIYIMMECIGGGELFEHIRTTEISGK